MKMNSGAITTGCILRTKVVKYVRVNFESNLLKVLFTHLRGLRMFYLCYEAVVQWILLLCLWLRFFGIASLQHVVARGYEDGGVHVHPTAQEIRKFVQQN